MDFSSFHIDQKYKIIKMLGMGFASKVFLAEKVEDNSMVAMKIYLPKGDKNFTEKITSEVDIIKSIVHDNVVQIDAYSEGKLFLPDSVIAKKVLYSSMKICENGEIFDFIKSCGHLPENFARFYFKKIVQTLKHIHKSDVAHRDLKLENIFLDKDFNPVIGDFGFAINLVNTVESEYGVASIGTRGYQSPEYLERKNKDFKTNDVFALGVILFIFCFGGVPFGEAKSSDYRYKYIYSGNYEEFWKLIKKAAKRDYVCPNLMELLNGLLANQKRFSLEDVENSLWYNGNLPTNEQLIEEMTRRKASVTEKKQDFNLSMELLTIPPYRSFTY